MLLQIWGWWESKQLLTFSESRPDKLEFTGADEHELGDELLELGGEKLVLDELNDSILDSEEELVINDGWSKVEIRLLMMLLDTLEMVMISLGSGEGVGMEESVGGALKV